MSGLMTASSGLTKSKLALATAVPGDVVAPKSFYAGGSKDLKTGTLVERAATTGALSYATSKTDELHLRISQGAYRTNAASGYPEITVSRAGALTGMNLNFSGNWEVIGFGGHMGSGWGTDNNENAQRCITWANGWSANLPQGTYRVLVCFGQQSSGGSDLSITIGGVEKSHAYGTYWNCDDVTFTGRGALVIRNGIASRDPGGVVIVVWHQR